MRKAQYFITLCRVAVLGTYVWGVNLPSQVPKSGAAQTLSGEERKSLNNFVSQTKDYISKEHALPADRLKPTTDVAVLDKDRQDLRLALQQSRPNAKQGDFFTAPVSAIFRKLLTQTLNGRDGKKVRASLLHAEPTAPKDLTVNHAYPNANGQPIQSVPPSLLLNLPVLPKGLEYCVAGKALALRDTDANMVVDLLPDALP